MKDQIRDHITSFFRQYWIVIACAIFVGGISSFGQYYSIYRLGDEYREIPYLYQDSEAAYLSRIREAVEGHYTISSPYFFEYKEASAPLLSYGELFYALPIKLLHLDLIPFIHFTKFLFPAILYVLVFSFIHLILNNRSRITALAGSALILIAPDILNLGYLKNIINPENSFSLTIWTRLVNPITGALLLFSFFIILIKVRGRSLCSITIAGILFGLMPGYFFSFAFAGLTTTFIILFMLLKKNYRTVLRLLLIFPIAFLMNARYFTGQIHGILYGDTLATSLRNGLLITHKPLSNDILFLGLTIFLFVGTFLFFKYKQEYQREKTSMQFILAGLLAGLVAFNQQVITGKAIWPFHFVQYTKPLVYVVILYSGYLILYRHARLWRALMATLIIFLFGIGVRGALPSHSNSEQYQEYQRYDAIVDWLNTHGSKDCVVVAKEAADLRESPSRIIERLHLLIPAVTRCDSYISRYTYFNIPQDRIYHNYLAYLRLNGIATASISQYLKDNRRQLINVFYANWNEMFYSQQNDTWFVSISDVAEIERKIDMITERITTAYPIFMRQDFGPFLKQYRVDYLIYDKKYGGAWNEEWSIFLHKEVELGDFVIYSFK